MQRLKEEEDLVVLQPELESKPRVYYKNLHLMNTCFVSGSVTADVNGIEECAEGASVTLKQNDVEVGRAKTDVFGEFKIDKLTPQSGAYELTVSSVSWGAYATDVKVEDDSLYLGVIKLG